MIGRYWRRVGYIYVHFIKVMMSAMYFFSREREEKYKMRLNFFETTFVTSVSIFRSTRRSVFGIRTTL